MHAFAEKPKTSPPPAARSRNRAGQDHESDSSRGRHGAIETQASFQTGSGQHDVGLAGRELPYLGQIYTRVATSPAGAGVLQAKLVINQPGDEYEVEADRVSEQVMRMPEPRIQRAEGRSPAESRGLAAKRVHPGDGGPRATPGVVNEALTSPGEPLDTATRAFMEPRLGHDFGQVRIHHDARAAASAEAVDARAYTVGHSIVFGNGQYRPREQSGRQLLAHELSHVVQQDGRSGLIQRAPPSAEEVAEDEKKTKLKTALKSGYALADVVDGDATWTSDELQQVTDAFKLLPAADRKALKGVTLKRVTSLGGKTAGQFKYDQSVTDTTVVNEATLELANLAFKGGAPKSYFTIVHEVGHAVASLPLRTLVQAEHVATAEFNRLTDDSNTALDPFNTAVAALNATVDPLNDAVGEYNDAVKSGDKKRIAEAKAAHSARRQEYDKALAEEQRLKKIWQTAKKKTDKAEKVVKAKEQKTQQARISAADLTKIKKAAEAEAGKHRKSIVRADKGTEALGDEDQKQSAAYVDAVRAAGVAVEDFATKTVDQTLGEDEVEALIADVQKKLDKRDKQKKDLTGKNKDNPALTTYAPVEQDQNDWFESAKAHSLAHNRSARVQQFVKFVESNKIQPITSYAAENWPHKPEEFYAEAYSMYLTAPADLKAASNKLHDWFKAKKY